MLVTALVATALPVAARPYGAEGRLGEVRYGDVVPEPECVTFDDGVTQPMCFHWTTEGAHASKDGWVDATIYAFKRAWTRQVTALGYDHPMQDVGGDDHGGSPALDVYLADIGDDGAFGYCTSDPGATGETAPAYCVVDNDFKEFSTDLNKRKREMKGTAAHELFHAVQYAYDTTTPEWFSEGTAVWMEDQVFDGANTNRRYLDVTALRSPEDPFDQTDESAHYGSWLFWQFLGECEPALEVRDVWEAVRDSEADDIVAAVDGATDKSVGELLASFGAWNYGVGHLWSYEEGAAYLKRLNGTRPPLDASHELSDSRVSTDATKAGGAARTIQANPYGVHYVRIKAASEITVDITVNTPSGAALIRQTADGAYAPPQLCQDAADMALEPALFKDAATQSMVLAAGEAAVLVLTNPTNTTQVLTYRAVKQ